MLRDLQACIGAGVSMFLAGICLAETTVYQSEAAYLAALNSLGYEVFTEGFEDNPTWGPARSPLSARSIVSRGIVWTSNHPAAVKTPSAVSTASGQARSGSYAVFSSPHGDPDVITPTGFLRDGLILKRVVGATKLYGVGGWLSGFAGSRVRLFFDGNEANSAEVGAVTSPPHQFFGVIVTTGFLQVEVRETEGTLEDQKFIFADDFTFALKPGEVGTVVSVSSASLAGTSLAPGSILSAFGDSLAAETAQAPAGELPTSLGGTEVRIRASAGVERVAPLYFVIPAQINYVLPAGTPAGTATVTVLRGGQQAATGSLQVAVVAPGVFTANMDGRGPAAAWARIRP